MANQKMQMTLDTESKNLLKKLTRSLEKVAKSIAMYLPQEQEPSQPTRLTEPARPSQVVPYLEDEDELKQVREWLHGKGGHE